MKKIIILAMIILFGIVTTSVQAQTRFGWEVAEFPGFATNDTAELDESQEILPNFPVIPGYENLHSLKVSITYNGTGYLFLKHTFPSTLVYPSSGSSYVIKEMIGQGQYLDIKPLAHYNNDWYRPFVQDETSLGNGWKKVDVSQWISMTNGQPYPLDSIYVDTCYVWLLYNSNGEYYFDTWYYYNNYPEASLLCGYGDVISGLEYINSPIPSNYSLLQNYPNPFNPNTKIQFTIPFSGLTNLTVYNILGQRLATLVNQELPYGTYEYNFNGANLPSGNYLYTLSSGNYKVTKKMILLK